MTVETVTDRTAPPGFRQRFAEWSVRIRLWRKLAYLLAALAVISGIATVTTMTGIGYDLKTVLYLLYLDTVILLLLSGLIVGRLVKFWLQRRKGDSGTGFHGRLVLMFSLIAVTPAVLVAVFAAVFLNIGIQGWFSDRVKNAIEQSGQVAAAYLQEHRQAVRGDIFAMANDLNRQAPSLLDNPALFSRVLTTQAAIRNLSEAIVADRSGNILARTPFSQSLEFDIPEILTGEQVEAGDIVVVTGDQEDRIRALIRLTRFVDAYLIVGRFVDPNVVDYVSRIERGITQYRRVEERRGGLQVSFVMLFVVVAVMLLLAAAWVGLNLATRYARPISKLADAAESVRQGDLGVRIDDPGGIAEVETLVGAFNRMAQQLQSQKQGLVEANRELDERRQFTEAVLSGVSAGVIGISPDGLINLPNRSASNLLGIDLDNHIGEALGDVVPEMAGVLEIVRSRPVRTDEQEIRINRSGQERTLIVNVQAEKLGLSEIVGFVVTFDDITDLQSAERKAAWADVARRIAHEIRNPLTPIQLAAERLKRRYLAEISSDPETFLTCTDTIVRQVGDIGRMVDEFSSFARMPEPQMAEHDLAAICKEAAFLEDSRDETIEVRFDVPPTPVMLTCDREQLSRAIGNLVKNAAESVLARLSGSTDPAGRVDIAIGAEIAPDGPVSVEIRDNGLGLPKENRQRLTEPYVTSRDKGTGLGLAIVKKIVEDHHGTLELGDNDGGGARVRMTFWPGQLRSRTDNDIERAVG